MTAASKEFSRSSRRALVAAVYAAYAAIAVAVGSGVFDAYVLASIQAVTAGLAAWAGVWMLSRMTRHWRWGQAPDEALDEREIVVRLRVYHLAYVIYNAAVFLSLVLMSFLVDLNKLESFSYAQVSVLLWGVFLVGWTLPSAILAWTDRGMTDE